VILRTEMANTFCSVIAGGYRLVFHFLHIEIVSRASKMTSAFSRMRRGWQWLKDMFSQTPFKDFLPFLSGAMNFHIVA
jgi:hypothetical protein